MRPRIRQPWRAVLAPLDVATTDGRMLSGFGTFTIHPYFTYLLNPPSDEVVPQCGIVRTVTTVRGRLMATGVVWDVATRDLMAAGQVWPEISLVDHTSHRTPGGLTVFTRGTVGAVVAGQAPAWPDIRFILEES